MNTYIKAGSLKVEAALLQLVNEEILPGTDIEQQQFWEDFSSIVSELTPRNRELLKKRDTLQKQIDDWHRHNNYDASDITKYKAFLKEIGYLHDEGEPFTITTENVDTEICEQAGPQLVVPVKNARFALNAANARWGSLYDALYGSDAIAKEGETAITETFNPTRAQAVVTFAKNYLDTVAPLINGMHQDVTAYRVKEGKLQASLIDGTMTTLEHGEKCVGYRGNGETPDAVLLKNNNLHIEIQIDKESDIGSSDKAGVKDLLVEAAVTTIMDCEDSVTAVDAEDKVEVYRNWLGLIKGDLQERFEKEGKIVTRKLNNDREYTALDGSIISLHGRSLLFVRNVGHLMTNPAILDSEGKEVPEGIMDAVITSLVSIHDLKKNNLLRNSRKGSIYIVKPKMHGPEEVAFTVALFEAVEKILSLEKNTIKIGIMDEERRTTVNLKECIRAASQRVVFINTGFLDRTGDEIHTSMLAGAFVPKTAMKEEAWIKAYEDWNVDIGLECGLQGKAQIGKGMWAMPDEMAAMLEQKIAHPKAGANTAWVPSPTGAILHSIHYHQVNVNLVQETLKKRTRARLDDLLTIPLLDKSVNLSHEQITNELHNNAQGLLGYVVRWIEAGVGCSKVPDINDTGLMEDRATLRISSQHLANWLEHGICSEEEVIDALKKMSRVVDQQNAGTIGYIPLADSFNSLAFLAAKDLIFKGKEQPSGYTEPLLHAYRLDYKRMHR